MTDTPRLWDRRADETPNPTRPSSPTSPSALADPSVRPRVNTASKLRHLGRKIRR